MYENDVTQSFVKCLFLEAFEALSAVFHSMEKIFPLLGICGDDICKITHHLNSTLSDVIHYSEVFHIFLGFHEVLLWP